MADDAVAPARAGDPRSGETRSPETRLLDAVERLVHARAGRFAVHMHLSELRPHNRKPHHIRIASRTFDSLLNSADARLYVLTTGDIVLLCKDVRVDSVDYIVDKVRRLFKADPLARPGRASEGKGFTTWYDLEIDYDDFLSVAQNLAAKAKSGGDSPEDASAGRSGGDAFAGQALDPFSLAKINDSLTRTRIDTFIRQQPAVIIGADGTERILFQETFLAIGEVQRRLAPGFNITSNTWLFQHLTETIDKRILAHVARENFLARPDDLSLNLNIDTLRSSTFQRFDSQVGDDARRVVIELQQIDVFSDLDVYAETRDTLRERGYRVLLDGLNPLSLQFFNPGRLDADLVKVGWGEEFSDTGSIEDYAELGAMVEDIGAEKFILARTDSEDAVKWALQLGIRRFQGFFIDRLVERQIAKEGKLAGEA